MIHDGRVIGLPLVNYTNTKAAIEALSLTAADVGATAWATDTEQVGIYDGVGWVWYSPADMLKSVYDTDNDGVVNAADYATTTGDADTVDGEHASAFEAAGTAAAAIGVHAALPDVHHAAVTLKAGHDAALSLSGQELDLADVLTPTEHTAIGDAAPHHAAVTLDANADTLLSLSTQQLGLDTQVANRVMAGPASGAAAVPTFRALVAADLPAATTAAKGVIELATDGEVAAATAGVVPTVPQLPLYRQANGALQADTGGNARGSVAIDLQITRGAVTQVASGAYSSVRGRGVTASGLGAHAEGYVDPIGEAEPFTPAIIASGMGSHAEGYSYGEEGNTQIVASGIGAHAEGYETLASGMYSHAEGGLTSAIGGGCHAEGLESVASGDYSHAEGRFTSASGKYAHAEGDATIASANASHAQGLYSIASLYGEMAHASGRFGSVGDAQMRMFVMRRAITSMADTTWYKLYLDGSSAVLTIPANALWNFLIQLVGLTSGATQRWSYDIHGTVVNDGGVVTLIESVVTTRAESDAAYAARVIGNDTSDCLDIEVQRSGGTAYTVRWVAVVQVIQVIYS